MGTIFNAANVPLNRKTGTLPDVSGALKDYFQPMTFVIITKSVKSFQVKEAPTSVNFQGVMQPYKPQEVQMLPIGQRNWSWFWLHAEPALQLKGDDVVLYNGVRTRVMDKKDYSSFGYMEYHLVQDWE